MFFFILKFVHWVRTIPIDNNVVSKNSLCFTSILSHNIYIFEKSRSICIGSSVQCTQDSITLVFNTRNPFQGRIYVKGMSDKQECAKSFSDKSQAPTSSPSITFNFGACNMQRSRTVFHFPLVTVALIFFHIDILYLVSTSTWHDANNNNSN